MDKAREIPQGGADALDGVRTWQEPRNRQLRKSPADTDRATLDGEGHPRGAGDHEEQRSRLLKEVEDSLFEDHFLGPDSFATHLATTLQQNRLTTLFNTSATPAPHTLPSRDAKFEMAAFKVGIIIGSTRVVRAGPQITTWVLDVIKSHLESSADAPSIAFDLIDITTLNLPLFDEPGIPSRITSAEGYEHEHTRAWSRRIAALDGFVFVTSQHNWGIPAGLKNAIDYLFNEWKGKPAAIVTYGGHGGNKCGEQLKVVLGGGIDMLVVDPVVNLSFPSRELLAKAATGRDLALDAKTADENSPWAARRGDIVTLWEGLVKLLSSSASDK